MAARPYCQEQKTRAKRVELDTDTGLFPSQNVAAVANNEAWKKQSDCRVLDIEQMALLVTHMSSRDAL